MTNHRPNRLTEIIFTSQTIVVTQNFISCRLSKYFDKPERFIPERWMKAANGNETKPTINPYLVLPFSHGMRSCIARRFAEQNMLVLMIRVPQIFMSLM